VIVVLLRSGAAIWWACSVAVLLLSFVAAVAHPSRRKRIKRGESMHRVTAIIPIKSLHPGFERAQRSLFSQDYANLEISIVAAERDSPAVAAARRIQNEFPAVASIIMHSELRGAASPKLDTMWPAISAASSDLILTKDSNLVLDPGDVAALVAQLGPGVGLVSTISIATEPEGLPAWIEAAIINCYHARVLMLADAAGLGFGLGKVMLFRRTDLARAGGFECLASALGEDMALARAMGRLGLRTELAEQTSSQFLGRRRLRDVWHRHLRWMIIWRVQLPPAFFGDLLGSAAPTAAAGALAAPLWGLAPAAIAGVTFAAWFSLETVLCLLKGWPVSLWSLPAFVGREALTPLLWLRAWTTNRVLWGGAVRRAVGNTRQSCSRRAKTDITVTRDPSK
jgi:ceramide glucosyltransferase